MISCRLCKKPFKSLTNSHLAWKHHLTPLEYKKLFKVKRIESSETIQTKTARMMGNIHAKGTKLSRGRKKEISKSFKKLWKNRDFKKRMIAVKKKVWENPRRLKKASEATRKVWADPVQRVSRTKINRRVLKGIRERPGYRVKRSLISKELWKNPEYRKKMAWEGPRGPKPRLTEVQWKELIGLFSESPAKHGFKGVRWNILTLQKLLREKWSVRYTSPAILYQLKKRGCRLVPISPDEKPDFSTYSWRFKKWVGP